MKIYIAHNFSAGPALAETVAPLLKSHGHELTSTWITDPTQCMESSTSSALLDLQDIDRADAVLLFTDQTGNTPGRGKWFEFGYAYAKGKTIYLCGIETECVFLNLPGLIKIPITDLWVI